MASKTRPAAAARIASKRDTREAPARIVHRGVDALATLLRKRSRSKDLVLKDRILQVGDDEIIVVIAGRGGTVARTIQVEGAPLGLRELELGARGASFALDRMRDGEPVVAAPLSEAESAVLTQGGFRPAKAGRALPTDVGRLEYLQLLREAMTPEQAALRLGVNPSRIRQRLGARTLYGVKDGRGWRLPLFQFVGKRLVPGIDKVLPRLPETMHPVAVARWFGTPTTDLGEEGEGPRSPRSWLVDGRPYERVAELAAEL